MAINSFSGPHAFLSNFHPVTVVLDGVQYPTLEHAYQAAKTTSPEQRDVIRRAMSPAHAKRLGRSVTLRPDWDDRKLETMRDLVAKKFAPGTILATQLLATGDEYLEEGNWWGDKFWGVCNGVGRNYLGKLLMAQRMTLRVKETPCPSPVSAS
jgi:ribA/ribD-fused uncharacterized protein